LALFGQTAGWLEGGMDGRGLGEYTGDIDDIPFGYRGDAVNQHIVGFTTSVLARSGIAPFQVCVIMTSHLKIMTMNLNTFLDE
jgi:hypothetical protein